MKKKLFLSIVALFVFSVFLIRVNAATTSYPPLFQLGWDIPAKAPKISGNALVLPATDLAYGAVTNEFDFSKVVFAKNGGGTIEGKEDLRKIIIGELQKSAITGNAAAKKGGSETNEQYVERLLKNYFTAYCLDESLKYPVYGLFNQGGWLNDDLGIATGYSYAVNNDGSYNATNAGVYPQALQAAIAVSAIMNDSSFDTLRADLKSEGAGYSNFNVVMPDGSEGVYIEALDGGDIEQYYEDIMSTGTSNIKLGLMFIGFEFSMPTGSQPATKQVFYVSDSNTKDDIEDRFSNATVKYILGSAYSEDLVPLKTSSDGKANLKELGFQKFNSTTDTTALNNKDHALWIVENSYPTLTISQALTKAGVTETTFKSQVKSLYGISDADVDKYTEMVIYGIVQYAIWNVTGYGVGGDELGNSITTGGSELNKLYQYLINSANVPANYGSAGTYSQSIKITTPEDGKELYKTTTNYDYYGPYKATYNALVEEGNKIQYSISDNSNGDFKIVNSSFNEISEITKDSDFYIQTTHNKSFTDININLSVGGITTFKPTSSRGRVYNPISGMSQNALIAGRATQVTITGDFNINGNPETGVQNIALLLMVTLVAFTLGYLVLSYKQKPIQLQK